jgi:diguanylate cyclase (GGDEF)-like protein
MSRRRTVGLTRRECLAMRVRRFGSRLAMRYVGRDDLTDLGRGQRGMRLLRRDLALRRPGAVILCNMDDFKRLNDRYCWQMGDEILRLVGGIIAKAVPVRHGAYRLGGDEFVIRLAGFDTHRARALAEDIRTDISTVLDKIPLPDPEAQPVTARLAIAVWTRRDAPAFEPLMHALSDALGHPRRQNTVVSIDTATLPEHVNRTRRA